MKDIFILFQLIAPKRYSRFSKNKFVAFLSREIEALGYRCSLEKKWVKRKFLGGKSLHHLVVGDLYDSDVVVVAGYDTATTMMFKNYRYYPLSNEKNLHSEMLNTIIGGVGSIVLILVLYYLVYHSSLLAGWNVVLTSVVFFILTFLLIRLGFGIPNANNFNKNNAAVVVLFKLIKDMQKQNKQKISYIFADGCSMSLEGYTFLQELIAKKNPYCQVIILDCVGNGKNLFFVTSSRNRTKMGCSDSDQFIEVVLPDDRLIDSPLSIFKKCTYVTRGQLVVDEIEVLNTRSRRDTRIDLDHLEQLENILLEMLSCGETNKKFAG